MESNDRRFIKGFFSPLRLAVADRYMRLSSRKRLFMMGGIAGLVLAVVFLADAFVGRAATVARGPLSKSHALFGKDCSTCHTAMAGATDTKCQSCHQKGGRALGIYGFARHYEYKSGSTDRKAPGRKEVACGNCHREHQGRDQSLQTVVDAQCTSCHKVRSLKKHPDFEFITKKTPDPANLKFPHLVHVRELMDEYKIDDAEAACLRCHVPQRDGRTFEPITYARACGDCHISGSTSTPYVPLRAGGGPGVATLAEIRRSGGPRGRWADNWNANEFSEQGGQIQKSPIYHADPWVLFNLQKLRKELYPKAELADLLLTSPEVPAHEARKLHEEAIQTLQDQIEALRGDPSPDVQRELAGMTELLKQIEARVDKPYAPLDETKFGVSVADLAPGVNEAAYRAVVDSLTAPCQTCHVVEKATIRRVQTDQRSLIRAEFNHRAHVIHARCLDCHSVIPMRKALTADQDLTAEQDRAEIVNLPGLKTCQSCHTSRKAANTCTSCHLFHPDKSHQANLSR